MYNPTPFNLKNADLVVELIHEYPLGLLISQSLGQELPETNYYPFVVEKEGRDLSIVSHLSKANSQWKDIHQRRVLVQFQGPSGYVSPSVYKNPLNVPTWNYCTVALEGEAQIIETQFDLYRILQSMTNQFEKLNLTKWDLQLPEEFISKLAKGIVGLRVKVEKIEAKYKMSQNREPEDYAGVVSFFKTKDSKMSAWLKKTRV